MLITPDSKVKLIKNPLKLDSNNEMMFTNATAQYNYFTSLPKLEFDNLTYVRKDEVLRIPTDETGSGTTYEDLLQYNFCMYQNTHFDNKWFYAFITDVKWINPSLTEIKLETAYYQTWQFDLVFMDSFIEREHVNDDTIGLHTLPEGLETGEFIVNNIYNDNTFLTNLVYIVGSTCYPNSASAENSQAGSGVYNGIYSGVKYFRYDDVSSIDIILELYAQAGKSDSITGIFLAPSLLAPLKTGATYREVNDSTGAYYYLYSVNKNYTLDGYTPKNNKLKCFPYNYLMATNNNGNAVTYRYELFKGSTCDFGVYGALTPGCSIFMNPVGYKRNSSTGSNYSEGLTAGKFPTCNFANDMYTNWLTQQSVNHSYDLIKSGVTGFTGGLAIGGIAGGIAGGALGLAGTIWQQMREKENHQFIPPQVQGNINCGDVTTSLGINTFSYYQMSIRSEFASIIDSYFSMYGYLVNRVGTPHLHVRTYYDYIKTNGINIEGNVPEPDLNQIRSMFDNGIRFWHDTSKYLDFSVNNSIIS